ncbi:MAG: hypothetical protein US49_C0002G0030 [candidate division TM6 bacterium GW2011_GWF2_37_49]|nr:MAG: hypothetical protein US49_C0002G0030 [candidate division TM6 bacterium GW2011_GWF2_37_49]
MKFIVRSLQFFLISMVLLVFMGMTDCGDGRKVNSSGDPNFVALKEAQGSYEAVIIDELSRIEVRDVSFLGITKIGGILYEENDAAGILDIEDLIGKTIKIIEDNYKINRYPDKQLIKAKIIDSTDSNEPKSISSLRDVEICGIEKASGKTLFKAEILDGKNISVFKDSEFSGIDKKTGKTLFNAKVVETSDTTKSKSLFGQKNDDSKDILIPRDIVVCGIEKKTSACMAWFIRKIDSIEFRKLDASSSFEANIDMKFKKAVTKVSSKK